MGIFILILGGILFLLVFNLLLIFILYRKWKKRLIRYRSEYYTRGRSEFLNKHKPQPVKSNHFEYVSDWFQTKWRSSFRIQSMKKYSFKRRRKRRNQPLDEKESTGVVQKSLMRFNSPYDPPSKGNVNKRKLIGRNRTKTLPTQKNTNIDANTEEQQNERVRSIKATISDQTNKTEFTQASSPKIQTLSTLFEIHFDDVVNTLSRLEQSTNEKSRNVP